MPAPPSNPLTMLRKLGTSLIGQDGLLTTAASTALGYSPMDRVKTRLAAQSEVQGQEKFKQEQDLAARRAEADRLALETNTYNLGRTKAVNAQADAERAAKGAQLAGAMVPGPPNPDGSPIISPDAAIGMAEGKLTQYGLDKMSGQETMTPALANELKNLGMDPGVQVGEKFDTSQLDRALQAHNLNDATKARVQAAREAIAARADQRDHMATTRTLNTYLDEQNRVAQSPQIRAGQQILASVLDTKAQVQNFLHARATGDEGTANQILAEAITVAFAKVRDPNSVVREGEVTRLLAQWGLADQAGNWLNKQIDGGVLPPDALMRLQHALEVDADTSFKIVKAEQDRLSNMQRAGNIPDYYGRDFTLGYQPSSALAPANTTPPRMPGAPLPAGSNLFDNLHRKFPQKR